MWNGWNTFGSLTANGRLWQKPKPHKALVAPGSTGTRLAFSRCVHQTAPTLALPSELTREFLVHHRVCPSHIDANGTLVVLIADGGSREAIAEVGLAYKLTAHGESLPQTDLERAIDRVVTAAEFDPTLDAKPEAGWNDPIGEYLGADVRQIATQPPVIRYLNALMRDAFEVGASDIHLETTSDGSLTVRFRLDGVLTTIERPSSNVPQAIVSRVKLLAELDIAERRRPQDGRIRLRLETRELDMRVSVVPTLSGESVVIRLLDQGERPVELQDLGLHSDLLRELTGLVDRPNGLVLVTGPTGSGKTTTLYSALSRRPCDREKIITVEDPIEYQLRGIVQVPVHARVGVTTGSILRSILRQDPDVLMVGEMRDEETAEMAIQAAMTGHLVFSTLHTTDAVGAVPRLLDLGIPEYLLAATLEGVLAQRLVRRICDACRSAYQPAPEHLALVAGRPMVSRTLTVGVGCAICRGSGYRGRVGIFELLRVDAEMKDAISRRASRVELTALASARGMKTLREDGWDKVLAGVTTVEEVARAVHD